MAKQWQNINLNLRLAPMVFAGLFMQLKAVSQSDTGAVRFKGNFSATVTDTVHFVCKQTALMPKPVAIIFKEGSAKINRRDSILLAKFILPKLTVCKDYNITIPASNLEGFHGECALDWDRTEALVLYFVKKGIAENRIVCSLGALDYHKRNIFNVGLTFEKPVDFLPATAPVLRL